MFKTIWKYIRPDKYKFIIFITLTVGLTILSLIYPYLYGKTLEALVNIDMKLFIFFLLLSNGIDFIEIIFFQYIKDRLHDILELNFMKRISKDLYSKVLKMPVKAFDEHNVGEYINRIYNDPDKIIELIGRIIKLLTRVLNAIFIIILSFTISWIITIELLLMVIVIYFLSKLYYPKIRKNEKEMRECTDQFVSKSTQTLIGVREVKVLGLRRVVSDLIFKNIDSIYNKKLIGRKYEVVYNKIIWAISVIFEVIIIFTAGYMFFKEHISLALLLAFYNYTHRVFDVSREVSDLGVLYQRVLVSMNRIIEILDNKLYDDEVYGVTNIDSINGEVEFSNINFDYDGTSKVLKNLNIKFETGKKIAIVGKSGMGKSTIFNLLLKLYEPKSGKILIDGIDIREINEESLRKHISIIRQEPYLFNMSIMENFKLVNPDITLEEVRKQCEQTYIDEYIMSLPKQYDTIIGEGGINLSGGQKQRLAIARTLDKRSKIILFDEATSALDNESQLYIKKTIDSMVKDHTIIIIAHRLSTILDADVIFLIDDGKVIATGTHKELLEKSEIYRNLYTPELLELNI
jgi:ATP-binding cassette subfamily B protein